MLGASERSLTVSELNEYARRLLAGDPLLRNLEVSGEISGYKHHFSGHRYFTLKDSEARVQCVMFRQNAQGLDFQPEDGMKVTVCASASIFTRDGTYQLYVSSMHKSGRGDLYVRFEQLKARLSAEGLFDPARKREIPLLPKTIGVVTAETGAALRDIIHVAKRRNPNIGILVSPCAVQGETAAKEIVRAIQHLNAQGQCDVLLVGRGGGAIEDLWAFNEEIVARAIAASKIPVISCVGHEVDFTIADFVADLRAPTPSAAAELAVPVLEELQASLDAVKRRMASALTGGQRARRAEWTRLSRSMPLSVPARALIAPRAAALESAAKRLETAFAKHYERSKNRLQMATGLLRTLNPENVVERGYAIVMRENQLLPGVARIAQGDALTLRMADGSVQVSVNEVELKDNYGEEKTDV